MNYLELFLVILIMNHTSLANGVTATFNIISAPGDSMVNRVKIKTLPSGNITSFQSNELVVTTADTAFEVLDMALPGTGGYAACASKPMAIVEQQMYNIVITAYPKSLCDFCAMLNTNDFSYPLSQKILSSYCCHYINVNTN